MNRIFKKHSILSLVLVIVLIAAMALSVVSCDKKDVEGDDTAPTTQAESATSIGEGERSFDFIVAFADGSSKAYTVHTNETIVGNALVEVGLISGEEGQFGLYVKTVDGVTLDYDTDGKYWAFYVDGSYAMAGVDSTEIEAGKVYTFKAE